MNYDGFIGLAVYRVRLEAKKTQRDCCVALGLSQAEFCRLENGRCQWTVNQLVTIARFLGLSLPKLMRQMERI